MTRFGDLAPLCRQVPSYTWCNLFFRQLQKHDPAILSGLSSDALSAPVGVNPECGIPRVNHSIGNSSNSLGNIADIIACGLSLIAVVILLLWAGRRKAAVGRTEIRIFLVLYALTLPFQLLTTGAVLEQGSTALVVLTAIHAGFVAALFWSLLANGLVATQVVEDGTLSSLIPFGIFTIAFFVATTYISLDTALSFTSTFGPSNPPSDLNNIAVFVLTSIWPGVAALLYFIVMAYVVLGILRERRPMLFYLAAAVAFVLAQLAWFLLGKVVCRKTNSKIDGSFIATVLETVSVFFIFFGWRSITEDTWDDGYY